MPWSPTLISALRSPAARLRLSLYRIPEAWGPGSATGSAGSTPDAGIQGIGTGAPIAMSSQGVSVPSWSTSRGSVRVALGSLAAGQWAGSGLPRGSLVTVGARVSGMSSPDALFRGQLRDIQGIGPQSIVSAWDLVSAALTQSDWYAGLDSGALFYHCDPGSIKTRTLTATYTPGDSSLTCNAATDFSRQTGQPGAVLVTPISGAEPFILTFTGLSGSTVTGVSDAHGWGPASSVAAANSTVQEVAWMVGHPMRVAARILASTGTGANGVYDVYPAAWGLGVPERYIDTADLGAWVLRTNPSSGTHSVRLVSTTAQPQGGSWLEGRLSAYGMWLTMRQGEITARGCVDYGATRPPIVMTLDRSNILRGNPSRSIYHSGSAVEYARTRTSWGTVTPSSRQSTLTIPATVPALGSFVTDFGDELYQNTTAIADRLNQRLGYWNEQVPEAVQLVCRLDAAQLCPGDWVLIDHPGLWGPGRLTASRRPAMVGDMSVDWSAGQVTVTAYTAPTEGGLV